MGHDGKTYNALKIFTSILALLPALVGKRIRTQCYNGHDQPLHAPSEHSPSPITPCRSRDATTNTAATLVPAPIARTRSGDILRQRQRTSTSRPDEAVTREQSQTPYISLAYSVVRTTCTILWLLTPPATPPH